MKSNWIVVFDHAFRNRGYADWLARAFSKLGRPAPRLVWTEGDRKTQPLSVTLDPDLWNNYSVEIYLEDASEPLQLWPAADPFFDLAAQLLKTAPGHYWADRDLYSDIFRFKEKLRELQENWSARQQDSILLIPPTFNIEEHSRIRTSFSTRLDPEDIVIESYAWFDDRSRWAKGREIIYDLTYNEIGCYWSKLDVCQLSEQLLYIYRNKRNCEIRRMFVTSPAQLSKDSISDAMYRVARRHSELGYQPRFVSHGRCAAMDIGVAKPRENFHGLFAMGGSYVVFIRVEGDKPLMVKTEKPAILKESYAFLQFLWDREAIDFCKFQKHILNIPANIRKQADALGIKEAEMIKRHAEEELRHW